jgi:hypothetical protein
MDHEDSKKGTNEASRRRMQEEHVNEEILRVRVVNDYVQDKSPR